MKYAVVEAGKVVNVAVADAKFAASQGWVKCEPLVEPGWLFDGQTFTPPELDSSAQAQEVRESRDKLLADTDWVVIKAYERGENIPAAWEMYRQALRDITAQEGFPHSVEWPNKPE